MYPSKQVPVLDGMTQLWNIYRRLGDALRSSDGHQMLAISRWMVWKLEQLKETQDDSEEPTNYTPEETNLDDVEP